MFHTHLPLIIIRCQFMNQNLSVAAYFLWWLSHSMENPQGSSISCSSCEAEIKATDECIKNIQMFHHILTDLDLVPSKPPPIYNDNRGAGDWSNSFSTTGIHHHNIRENTIREAQQLQEVSISHIPGTCNPADIFTKEFQSDCTFRSLRALLLSPVSSFPVPCLHGGCWDISKFENLNFEILKFQIQCKKSHTFLGCF
jgi:hypothetical protein